MTTVFDRDVLDAESVVLTSSASVVSEVVMMVLKLLLKAVSEVDWDAMVVSSEEMDENDDVIALSVLNDEDTELKDEEIASNDDVTSAVYLEYDADSEDVADA